MKSATPPAASLKQLVLKAARTLLQSYTEDIESGITDGIYDPEDNKETRNFIEETEALLNEFEKYKPEVYAFIEGGNLQGVSASEPMSFTLFDNDNYEAGIGEDGQSIYNQTPEEWDKMISSKTASGELVGIY